MSTALKGVLLYAILVVAANGFAQLNIVNFDFGNVPVMCGGGIGLGYQGPVYRCAWPEPTQNFNGSPGFGWTMYLGRAARAGGGSGLTLPDTTFEPPPFDGLPFTQVAFLQDEGGAVSQSIPGFSAGSYTLGFYLGSRYYSGPWDGNQTVEALIDGNVIGTWALVSYTPFTLQTIPFTVTTSGSHTLTFRGLNPGDHTAFFSYVTITPTER